MRKQGSDGRMFRMAAVVGVVLAAGLLGLWADQAAACPVCSNCGEAGPCTELQYFLYGDCKLNFGDANMGDLPEEKQNRTVSFIDTDPNDYITQTDRF